MQSTRLDYVDEVIASARDIGGGIIFPPAFHSKNPKNEEEEEEGEGEEGIV